MLGYWIYSSNTASRCTWSELNLMITASQLSNNDNIYFICLRNLWNLVYIKRNVRVFSTQHSPGIKMFFRNLFHIFLWFLRNGNYNQFILETNPYIFKEFLKFLSFIKWPASFFTEKLQLLDNSVFVCILLIYIFDPRMFVK